MCGHGPWEHGTLTIGSRSKSMASLWILRIAPHFMYNMHTQDVAVKGAE